MRKFTALICAIFTFGILLCSCGDVGTNQTTDQGEGLNLLNIKNGVLYECAGQADENGVYTVPDEVSIIGEGAFSNDTTIKKVIIGKNVKQIAEGAFYGNSNIEQIVISEGVEIIGGGAFVGCTALTDIIIPNSVTELGPYAFYYCTSLKSVKLPAGISAIYEYTFAQCPSLESVSVPEGVKEIKTAAFYECASLSSVALPKTLETIGEAAFACCYSLASLDLSGTSVSVLDDSVFVSCTELKKIVLPETLESIGFQTFYDCPKLYDVNIPNSVASIGAFALNLTPWYEEISEDYKIVGDGVLIKCSADAKTLDLSGKGIKHIGSSAFWNAGENSENGYKYASSLSEIVIPDGVISIGDYAFSGCSLDKVSLPATLETIGDHAFNSVLQSGDAGIDFSALTSLTSIGASAFANCSAVTKVALTSSVRDVGVYAFFKTGAMETFLENARATEDTSDDFWISGDGVLLLCLVNSEQKSITVPDGVKIIGGGAFAGWDSATIYDTNEGITDKYWYNAWNMDKVTNVVLPDGVEKICGGAFLSASSLAEINVPDSVSYIGEEAFKYCKNLYGIELGNGVKVIEDGAFAYSGLYSLILELIDIEHIGDEIFYGCKNIAWVTFPVELSDIGSNLFVGCSSFANIYVSSETSARLYDIIGNDFYSSIYRSGLTIHYYTK